MVVNLNGVGCKLKLNAVSNGSKTDRRQRTNEIEMPPHGSYYVPSSYRRCEQASSMRLCVDA
jgi:hypothetical protein